MAKPVIKFGGGVTPQINLFNDVQLTYHVPQRDQTGEA